MYGGRSGHRVAIRTAPGCVAYLRRQKEGREKSGRRREGAPSSCPCLFPLWDFEIAKAFGCSYGQQPASQYLAFVRKTKYLAEQLTAQGIAFGDADRTSLKVLDEYNYARYTKHWV